jgi:hypothetical protein
MAQRQGSDKPAWTRTVGDWRNERGMTSRPAHNRMVIPDLFCSVTWQPEGGRLSNDATEPDTWRTRRQAE